MSGSWEFHVNSNKGICCSTHDGRKNIIRAFDKTWQKYGNSSLDDDVEAVSLDTGGVSAAEILTEHCKIYEQKKEKQHNGSKNYNAYSNNKEVDGAANIFHRSEGAQNIIILVMRQWKHQQNKWRLNAVSGQHDKIGMHRSCAKKKGVRLQGLKLKKKNKN